MDGETYIYVLRLEDGKYYVGKTTNVQKRLKEHQEMRGSAWTRKYRVQQLMGTSLMDSGFDEDNKVKELMEKHGISNVRGGSYSQIDLPEAKVQTIKAEISSATRTVAFSVMVRDT